MEPAAPAAIDAPRPRAAVPARGIFLEFLKLGVTAFGGPAMLAHIREATVNRKKWLSGDSFQEGIALCQVIPGATMMQIAGYAGFRAGGFRGLIAAYAGFALPAFGIMLALSALYRSGRDLSIATSVLIGLQAVVVALLFDATLKFGRSTIKGWRHFSLAVLAAGLFLCRISPVATVLAMAACGLLVFKMDGTPKPRASEEEGALGRSIRPALLLLIVLLAGVVSLHLIAPGLLPLSVVMLKVDLFAFGGGFASLPLMLHEVVVARHWLDSRVFMDGIALGQVTPGPIVITATFIGYQIHGFWGAVIGTVSIFTPSVILLTLAIPHFDRLQGSILFRRATQGILSSFVGMLLGMTIRMGWDMPWRSLTVLLSVSALIALQRKVPALWLVCIAILVSIMAH